MKTTLRLSLGFAVVALAISGPGCIGAAESDSEDIAVAEIGFGDGTATGANGDGSDPGDPGGGQGGGEKATGLGAPGDPYEDPEPSPWKGGTMMSDPEPSPWFQPQPTNGPGGVKH